LGGGFTVGKCDMPTKQLTKQVEYCDTFQMFDRLLAMKLVCPCADVFTRLIILKTLPKVQLSS